MDKATPADWFIVKPKSVITVSDAQGIQDSMKRGKGVRGIDYTVRTVARMDQLEGLSTHLFFTLDDPEQAVNLLVKIVDNAVDLFLYFPVPGLEPGGRRDLLDRGMLWLFQEPSDPNNYTPEELRYSMTVRQTVEKDGSQVEVIYNEKGQGELQCKYQETPPRSGMKQDLLATVVEYRAVKPVENPEFLVLEVGEQQGPQSYVQFFLGCPIKLSEVDVLSI
jgi:hypothetical protein